MRHFAALIYFPDEFTQVPKFVALNFVPPQAANKHCLLPDGIPGQVAIVKFMPTLKADRETK